MANIGVSNNVPRVVGCIDPLAINYNPLATDPCGPLGQPQLDLNGQYVSGCCLYPSGGLTGCMDPQANNYNSNVTIPCSSCCNYGHAGNSFDIVINPAGPIENADIISCDNLFIQINNNGVVYNANTPIKEECCQKRFVGQPVYWDGEYCYTFTDLEGSLCESLELGLISQIELENRVICIDCDNFAWWDNLYSSINGDSLQNINVELWDFLVSIIAPNQDVNFNNGSFYVDSITGEPIVGEECCGMIPSSNFTSTSENDSVSACLCNIEPNIELDCECISKIKDFLQIVSTLEGSNLLLNLPVLTSLGLTVDEATFVINNLLGDSVPLSDKTTARILISNVLTRTGGFYACYEKNNKSLTLTLTDGLVYQFKKPVEVSSTKCTDLGGFYDGVLCYCKPQEDCLLTLTNVEVTTTLDQYNQQISVVTFKGESISETCCLKLADENNLPWVYKQYNGFFQCFVKDPNPCLPLEFNLNKELIKPECDNPLDVSVSFYFKKPENPCVDLDGDDDVIIVDGDDDPCLLTFDENNNIIDYNSAVHTKKTPLLLDQPLLPTLDIPPLDGFVGGKPKEPCCFNPSTPIQVQLAIKDDKDDVVHTSDPFSFAQFDTWFDLSTEFTLPETGTTEGYYVSLQFTSGLNCCCVYDIFLDNLNFSCSEEEEVIDIIKNSCPGFNIVPVIDNKKSWVYNPGKLDYSGIFNQGGILTDNTIIENGDDGLINGYGVINRTFAPSPDADIPWRYTDYFNQSSILEKHSNLVLNSKELYLTFDMCSIGGPCPDGYTLSANTETCYKYVTSCPTGYVLSGDTCYSGITTATTIQELVTEKSNPLACKTKFTLLQLENYKKTFQNFWINFVEQFVPATTIFVAGEKWCNRPDEICTQYEECDFDFEFVEGDVTTTPNVGEHKRKPVTSEDSNTVEPNLSDTPEEKIYNTLNYESTEDGPISTPTVKIIPLPKEPGRTISSPSIIDDFDIRLKRKEGYSKKLQTTETIA
jgi:hypothetical protein